MKSFETMELREAIAYAASGGQALHLHQIIMDKKKAPKCFVAAVNRGEDIAHLFDQDIARLTATARELGVRVIVVEREDTPSQHIDLCGKPLRLAKEMAKESPNESEGQSSSSGEPASDEDRAAEDAGG